MKMRISAPAHPSATGIGRVSGLVALSLLLMCKVTLLCHDPSPIAHNLGSYVLGLVFYLPCLSPFLCLRHFCPTLSFSSFFFPSYLLHFILLTFHSFSISFIIHLIHSPFCSYSVLFLLRFILPPFHSFSVSFFLPLILSPFHSVSLPFYLPFILSYPFLLPLL